MKYHFNRPLYKRRKSKNDKSIRYYSLLGLYEGSAVSGKLVRKCSGSSEPYSFNPSDSKRVRKANFGALAGLGVVFSTNPVDYFIETRYGHDIIHNNGSTFKSLDGQIRNTFIAIELGVQLRICSILTIGGLLG